jgi:hypothetical protein
VRSLNSPSIARAALLNLRRRQELSRIFGGVAPPSTTTKSSTTTSYFTPVCQGAYYYYYPNNFQERFLHHGGRGRSFVTKSDSQQQQPSLLDLSAPGYEKPSPEDERMLTELVAYREREGHVHVPSGSSKFSVQERQSEGVSKELSNWVEKQRRIYRRVNNSSKANFSKSFQVVVLMLESMGFVWSSREAQWMRWVFWYQQHQEALKRGERIDPKKERQLAMWVDMQRKIFKRGDLHPEREQVLNQIGFVFDAQESKWLEMYEKLEEYKRKNGHTMVPTMYSEDPSLGSWVARQRVLYNANQLESHRLKALETLGFSWDPNGETWDKFYQQLCDYHAKHGHIRVPRSEGSLWMWLDRQRMQLKKSRRIPDTVNARHRSALDRLGFDFDESDVVAAERAKQLQELDFSIDPHEETWWEHYDRLLAFKKKFGHMNVAMNYESDQSLADWVRRQRAMHKRNKLGAERVEALEKVGFGWTAEQALWSARFLELKKFKEIHGHLNVPSSNGDFRGLYRWKLKQKKQLAAEAADIGKRKHLGERELKQLHALLDLGLFEN